MKEKTGFLEQNPGNRSIMRLAFAWLVFQATAMGWYALIATGVGAASAIVGTVAGIATGLKIIQKGQEQAKTE